MNASGQTWEYLTIDGGMPSADLTALGQEGWELAGIAAGEGTPTFYFKRPMQSLSLRERVTLDQKRRYYDAMGLAVEASADATQTEGATT